MNISSKIEIIKNHIVFLATHDDEDAYVVGEALNDIAEFAKKEADDLEKTRAARAKLLDKD